MYLRWRPYSLDGKLEVSGQLIFHVDCEGGVGPNGPGEARVVKINAHWVLRYLSFKLVQGAHIHSKQPPGKAKPI